MLLNSYRNWYERRHEIIATARHRRGGGGRIGAQPRPAPLPADKPACVPKTVSATPWVIDGIDSHERSTCHSCCYIISSLVVVLYSAPIAVGSNG